MIKRILSMFIVLTLILVSIPMLPLEAVATQVTDSADASVLAVDKVISNFDGLSTTGTATVGDYTVNTGVGTNNTAYTTNDYSANANNSTNTVTIEDGVLKSTLTAESAFNFITYISPVSLTRGNTMPSSETTALQFHVDFTDVTSVEEGKKINFEIRYYLSTGTNSGVTAYCIPGKDFIYIPDATEEEPDPEAQILTTGGGVQVYHGTVCGYAGKSGTIIVPMYVWDTEALNQFGGSTTIWELYKFTQDYRHRSYIIFDTYSAKYSTGDVFAIDDICWMKKPSKTYDYEIAVQDFSEITDTNLNGWGNGPDWSKGTNYTVSENQLKLTKTCENTGRATTLFPIDAWNDDYDALAFDFDASEMVNDTTLGSDGTSHIRMLYTVNKTDTTAYAECYFDGTFQFVWEDGTVVEAAAKSYGASIPHGFKGQIIIPASAVSLSDAVKTGIEANAQSMFQVQLMSLVAAQKDTSVYIDNFVYYDNADQLEDTAGTDFSQLDSPLYETATPVTEEVRTVEAFFKTEANFSQSIIGTKFGSASYHGIFVEMSIISTGQLVLTVGSATTQVTNVALNDGNWHHIAMTTDDTASEIRCYIDGGIAKVATLESLTYPEYSDDLPLTIGNDMPAESMYYTVFDGSIANLRLWSDVRTAEEISSNKMESVGADAEGLVAEWLLDSEDITAETTGKYPLKNFYWNIDSANELFAQYDRDAAEDEFTIIFLPDTQTIIKNFSDQITDIFDWIIANAERLNVKAVVSLGDIIEYGTKEADFVTLSAQYARLTEAGIPAVATIGDHDYNSFETRDSTNYDNYFTSDMLFTNEEFRLGGYESESTIMNGYYYLTVANTKYLIMNLEVQPRDEILAWANDIVSSNKDCRVIVATHRYIARPDCSYVERGYQHGNSGQQMWEKFVSLHENIDMVLCGHAESSGYYANYAEGENGNNVLQVNCDMQNTDQSYKTVGAILIGRFKKDGSQVSFNLYSAHHNLYIDSNCNDRTYALNAVTSEGIISVGDNYYDDLGEALSNADGSTAKLLANVTVSEQITLSGNAVLELNGFTLEITNTLTVTGALTVAGNGNVAVYDTGLTAAEDGTITIEGGTFTGFNPVTADYDYVPSGYGVKLIDNAYTVDTSAVISDTDGDGKITSYDLSYLRGKLMEDIVDSNGFDTNGDGLFNAVDIVRAKKLSVE